MENFTLTRSNPLYNFKRCHQTSINSKLQYSYEHFESMENMDSQDSNVDREKLLHDRTSHHVHLNPKTPSTYII